MHYDYVSGLVDPKSVLSQYGAHNNKEVLSTLRASEYNHAGADPHYCALTSNLQAGVPMYRLLPHVVAVCKHALGDTSQSRSPSS